MKRVYTQIVTGCSACPNYGWMGPSTSGCERGAKSYEECPLPEHVELKKVTSNDIKTLVEWWNSIPGVPLVVKITGARASKAGQRIKEGILATLPALGEAITSSAFLSGKETNWRASFDWLIANDTNWVRVLEGAYGKAKKIAPVSRTESSVDRVCLEAVARKMKG